MPYQLQVPDAGRAGVDSPGPCSDRRPEINCIRLLPPPGRPSPSARPTSRRIREAPSDVPLVHLALLAMANPASAADRPRPPVQPPPMLASLEASLRSRRRSSTMSFRSHAAGVQPGLVSRQGGRPERLPAVAPGVRPGHGLPLDHPRVRRPADRHRLPETSLLLRKPTGRRPARGRQGLRRRRAASTRLLLDWLKAGAPARRPTTRSWSGSNSLPGPRTLKPGDHLQLRAVADVYRRLAAGRDLADAVRVQRRRLSRGHADGLVAARAARRDRGAGHRSRPRSPSPSFTAPFDTPSIRPGCRAKNNVIDEHVFAKLAALRIEPSDLCTDEEFVRRAFLDTMARCRPPDEVRAFLADKAPDKRAKLIDACSTGPSSSITGRCTSATCSRTARSATTTSAGPRASARSTPGSASRWPPTGRGTARPRRADRDRLDGRQPAVGYFVVTVGEHREPEKSEVAARSPRRSSAPASAAPVPQPPARKVHAGRLLPLRRLLHRVRWTARTRKAVRRS